MVSAHLALNHANRPFVGALEQMLSHQISEAAPCAIASRDQMLQAVFCAQAGRVKSHAKSILPTVLADYLGCDDVEALKWRSLMSGVRQAVVEKGKWGEASMLRVQQGQRMLQHTHRGVEMTLLLAGGFSDEDGHYRRGDLVIADEHHDHAPIADADEECFCFVVNEAPQKLTGPLGRIFGRFVGH